MPFDSNAVIIADAAVATMVPGSPRGDQDYGLIRDAALVVENGRVAWAGERDDVPKQWQHLDRYPVGGRLVTPGLVECHAQLLFGGDPPAERGAAGIPAVAAATRSASDSELLSAAVRRAWWLIRQGVTTLEVKTGYGLDTEGELRLLRLAGQLRSVLSVTVRVTLLAGHAYPPGTADADREDYVIGICEELLPAAIGLGILDYVEVYCEETAGLSMEHSSTILETVYRRKIPTRVAADHLSDSAGGALAPAFYAKAAAHLNYTDDIAVTAMGKAGTTAVLVPAADSGRGAGGHPPVGLLREHQVPMAVSTGLDPVTAPLAAPLAAAHLGVARYGLTRREALYGITAVATRALALADGTGTLVAGGPADFVIWDAAHPEELLAWLGAPLCQEVWVAGKPAA